MEAKENGNIKISIVVPVYNSARFLDDLFSSLLDQNLPEENYEIICVNDGSTDNSAEIIEKYAVNHKCIKVITQENAGQAAARNTGLFKAKGTYVWFVDSDDFIDTNALPFIVSSMDEQNIDELTVGLTDVSEDAHYEHKEMTFSYQPMKKINLRATCSGVKIFRRSIIAENNLHWHSELALCDDVLFIYLFELFSKKNAYLNSPSYYYRNVVNSTSHQKSEAVLNKHMYSLVTLSEIYRDVKRNPPIEMNKHQKRELDDRISLCIQTILYDLAIKGDKAEQEKTLAEFKEKGYYPYKYVLSNLKPKYSLQRTLYDFLMFFFPNEKMYRFIGGALRKIREWKLGKTK